MSQKDIWREFITAQSKILEYKSRPFRIDFNSIDFQKSKEISVAIDQEVFKNTFKKEVESVFKMKNFDFNNGYILADSKVADKITQEELNGLSKFAEICYVDFNVNPVIDGFIYNKNANIDEKLEEVIGELSRNYGFKKYGQIFLTHNQKEQLSKLEEISFTNKAAAIFQIKPSIPYIISTFYKSINSTQNNNRIAVEGELHHDVIEFLNQYYNLMMTSQILKFKFENEEDLLLNIEKLEKKGVEFSKNEIPYLKIKYTPVDYEKYGTDLNFEYNRLRRDLKKYLPSNNFTFSYTTKYLLLKNNNEKDINLSTISEDSFWSKLYSEIHGDKYQISKENRTISFEFESEEEYNEKLLEIKTIPYLDVYDRRENQKCKYVIKVNSGLHELQKELAKKFPSLSTKLVANGEKLIFRNFYKRSNKTEILSRLSNKLDEIIDESTFNFTINETFQEKYLCEENFELKVEQEEEKLSNLLKEEFYFEFEKKKYYLGKLHKVNYPEVTFIVEEDKQEEVKNNIKNVKFEYIVPDLKGEKDKVKRLEDTVLKLESDFKLPNDNAKEFLYDSSKAKPINDIENLLNKFSDQWKLFEDNLFSKSLNDSQREAVFKALYSEELAIIQGPPGTGKSTAIAEIIWQHIRLNQNQKILLTSETNLAVDNAIDRLKNNKNNLVKPVRFGNSENLESEGYFYSLDAMKKWKEGKSTQGNAVSHWLENISNRIDNQESSIVNDKLLLWKKHLLNPSSETKDLFFDKYLKFTNLIGATGSSIGKLNSENKWTSFFRAYLNVFYKNDYENNDFKNCNKVNIDFDTIIMDEASKATPPELALPVLFGKKSIIVGDHRQLPPMVDGEKIKDVLKSIDENKLADTLSNKVFETSQFERLFENIDQSLKGTFNTQYRMHPDINDVIAQFYVEDGGLFCGLPLDKAEHNDFNKWNSRYHGLSFKNFISPDTHTIWVNINSPEIKEGTSRINIGEIKAINNVLKAIKFSDGKGEFDNWLEKFPIEERQIGVVSFYGKQIQLINKMIKENHSDLPIRLSTVDKFQGMERNIMIVSMVRSNKLAQNIYQSEDFDLYPELGFEQQSSLGFAESPNRLNVALSRARRLLIIVGNAEHFCKKEIYKNVYDTIANKGKIIDAELLNYEIERYEQ
ncbi:AAA domain-containing protein [Chishuiella sp.]|uniref:DEAD/DEAH box helicase n=1 Tax=Chishuiella sp. TaxID=1969467 RepID=UPI0028AC8078|nr:AAA domain-containing protein [Chishuiella sp.]